MKSYQQFFVFTGLVSLVLLLTGLYKPWVVLWWRSHQNRRHVLSLYGSLLVASIAGYLAFALMNP